MINVKQVKQISTPHRILSTRLSTYWISAFCILISICLPNVFYCVSQLFHKTRLSRLMLWILKTFGISFPLNKEKHGKVRGIKNTAHNYESVRSYEFLNSSTMTAQKCKGSSHKEIWKHLQLGYSFGWNYSWDKQAPRRLRQSASAPRSRRTRSARSTATATPRHDQPRSAKQTSSDMSCASPNVIFRLTLLTLTFIISCTFIASVVWLLRTRNSAGQYENYYLSRINISARTSDVNTTSQPVSDHYKDLIKIEIAMRRVEENSRRLKEYTKSLLWDNKDKSLWCVLFKDSERGDKSLLRSDKNRHAVDEDYIRTLREQKMREAVIHLRHHGSHHRRRPEILPNMPYIK